MILRFVCYCYSFILFENGEIKMQKNMKKKTKQLYNILQTEESV